MTGVFNVICGKPVAPKKVAILGGGAASCTAALALTGQPGWKERYDVTIYQLGWRLGGKARSGRNKDFGNRTEEIILHLIEGNYHNTLNLLRSVYEELKRPEGSPMRTFEEAFDLVSVFSFQPVNWPSTEEQKKCFSLNHIMNNLLKCTLEGSKILAKMLNTTPPNTDESILSNVLQNSDLIKVQMTSFKNWLTQAKKEIREESSCMELLSVADIAITTIQGLLDDNILENGFDSLNHLDLREWYRRHGANAITLQSAFLKAHYEFLHGIYRWNHRATLIRSWICTQVLPTGVFLF